jgi:hypothetical protein
VEGGAAHEIRRGTGASSLTDVVRRALTVYDAIFTMTKEAGGKLVLRKPDGTESERGSDLLTRPPRSR